MGFLDNFLKKLGTKLATSYGAVSSGEYEGARFAIGNPPKEKVSVVNSFSQIIFIKNDEEVGRFNIGKDIIDVEYIETIQFPATGQDGFECKLTFENGDTCEVELFPSKVVVLFNNLKTIMLEQTYNFFENEVEKITQA